MLCPSLPPSLPNVLFIDYTVCNGGKNRFKGSITVCGVNPNLPKVMYYAESQTINVGYVLHAVCHNKIAVANLGAA